MLCKTQARFLLSTWYSSAYRQNEYISTLWGKFHIDIIEHFYHLGASEKNRNAIKESLINNYRINKYTSIYI